jgi:hypothetical protein
VADRMDRLRQEIRERETQGAPPEELDQLKREVGTCEAMAHHTRGVGV